MTAVLARFLLLAAVGASVSAGDIPVGPFANSLSIDDVLLLQGSVVLHSNPRSSTESRLSTIAESINSSKSLYKQRSATRLLELTGHKAPIQNGRTLQDNRTASARIEDYVQKHVPLFAPGPAKPSGPWKHLGQMLTIVVGLVVTVSAIVCLSMCCVPSHQGEDHTDVRACCNDKVDEDMYGFAIASLIQDTQGAARAATIRGRLMRSTRISLAMSLLLLQILLQAFMMMKILKLCAGESISNIREAYHTYEYVMYGNNPLHGTLTVNGKYRGKARYYQPENFDLLSDELKQQVCHIPFSQDKFFICVIFVWSIQCIAEFRRSVELYFIFASLPTIDSMVEATRQEKYRETEAEGAGLSSGPTRRPIGALSDGLDILTIIQGITWPIRRIITFGILLPRILLTGFLLWLGCMWLAATNDFSDLVLNGVALEFMMWLKNFLGQASMSARSKQELRSIIILPPSKKEPATFSNYFGTFLWVFSAFAFCCCYTYSWQRVLPQYRWDVRYVCAVWFDENYATIPWPWER